MHNSICLYIYDTLRKLIKYVRYENLSSQWLLITLSWSQKHFTKHIHLFNLRSFSNIDFFRILRLLLSWPRSLRFSDALAPVVVLLRSVSSSSTTSPDLSSETSRDPFVRTTFSVSWNLSVRPAD